MEQMKVAASKALDAFAREPDPQLSENAIRVLEKRYLRKDEHGTPLETPKEMFTRVRSEEHTSELQSRLQLVCRPLLEKTKTVEIQHYGQPHVG